MQAFLMQHFDRSLLDGYLDLNGTVYVRFTLTEQGDVQDAVIQRGVVPSWDAEALRVVRAMPKWEPRKVNGVAKPVMMTVPVKIYRR